LRIADKHLTKLIVMTEIAIILTENDHQ